VLVDSPACSENKVMFMPQAASSACVGTKLERASGPYLGFSTGTSMQYFCLRRLYEKLILG